MPVSRKRTKAKSKGAGARSGDPRKAAQQKKRFAAKMSGMRSHMENMLSDAMRAALEQTGFPVSDKAWDFYSSVRDPLEAKLRRIFTGPDSLLDLEDKELLAFAAADKFRSLRMQILQLTDKQGKSTSDPEVAQLLERCQTLKTMQNLMLRGLLIDEDIRLARIIPENIRISYDEVEDFDPAFLEMMNTYIDVRYSSNEDKLPLSCPEFDATVLEMIDAYDELMSSEITALLGFKMAELFHDYCEKVGALKDTLREREEEQGCSLREMYHFELKQDADVINA